MQTKEGREMIDRKVLTAEEARKQRDHQGVAVELERDVLGFIANQYGDRRLDFETAHFGLNMVNVAVDVASVRTQAARR